MLFQEGFCCCFFTWNGLSKVSLHMCPIKVRLRCFFLFLVNLPVVSIVFFIGPLNFSTEIEPFTSKSFSANSVCMDVTKRLCFNSKQ